MVNSNRVCAVKYGMEDKTYEDTWWETPKETDNRLPKDGDKVKCPLVKRRVTHFGGYCSSRITGTQKVKGNP